MPLLTVPIHEVNHCHGPGRGHPCTGPGEVSCGPAGQCFSNAARWVREHSDSILVHGKVTNAAGRTFDHAWAEDNGDVIDPTTGVRVKKDRWYRLVKAKPEARYTSEQAAINMIRTRNHGPWTAEEVGKRILREFNKCHNPEGPGGGRFCSSLQQGGLAAWAKGRLPTQKSRRATKSEMRPATDAERRKLAIPPKYTDAMVATDPKAELRATAITPAGKTASYYSEAYTARQEAAKWARVMSLQRAMPAIAEKIDRDSSNPKREDYHAAMTLRLIALTGLRNGGEGKGLKESFGASSLRLEHVTVSGNTVRLSFPGKSGVAQDITVTDKVLADYVRSRQSMGAKEVFPHDSADTLAYMKKISGGKFKVHDLRTWNGTVMADRLVSEAIKAGLTPTTKKQFKALRKQVATEVAKTLGNTPAMALSTYIHPVVFRPLEVS